MKHLVIIVILTATLFSCSNKDEQEIEKLRVDMTLLSNSNTALQNELDSIRTFYIEPFKSYQEIVLKESQMNPDSIIREYETLINEYPNSFWSHEAKKRKENVKENRMYWKDGKWDFSKQKRQEILIEVPSVIFCPGC